MNNDNKPTCVCQEPSACPPSLNEFDHVSVVCNYLIDVSVETVTKSIKEGQ